MKRDLYSEVTVRIVAELETGAAPWIKPWSATPGANTPCNAVSNRPYSGCNVVLLWMAQAAGYRMPRYLTFKQALELGGHVRKGERGAKVYFVKRLEIKDPEGNSQTRLVPMMREYTVFNVDQCDGLPDTVTAGKPMRVRNPDARDDLADQFLRSTGADAAPWIKPWSATPGANTPCNAVSNRPYSGCNVVLLWMAQAAVYRTPRFLTFKQALELGGHVRKGERGKKVYFVKQLQVRDQDADDSSPTRLVLREYTVFNVDQCDGLPDSVTMGKPMRVRNPDARDDLAEEFLRSTGADIREGHGEAYYVPSHDSISLPAFEAFKGADNFYNVVLHELTHWTGHKSRLDRDLKNRFGSRNYAAEELIAELGAAFLCAEFGFDGDVRNAGYIASWIELLTADKRAFFTACSQASKAADYLRGLALAEARGRAA